MKEADFPSIAKEILSKADCPAEVFIQRSKSSLVKVIDGRVESVEGGDETGIALRVIRDKRPGFAYSTSPNLDELVKNALKNSTGMPQDDSNVFPLSGKIMTGLDLHDKGINKVTPDEKVQFAIETEKHAYKYDKRISKTENTGYTDFEDHIFIANSNGVSGSYTSSACGGFCQVISLIDGEMEEGYYSTYGRRFSDIDPARIGSKAAAMAVELAGGKLIESMKVPVILESEVAAQFVSVIASMLSAENVRKGKSLFAGRVESLVAGNTLDLIDDPLMPKGLLSRPFDSEGSSSLKYVLIDKGTLKGYMHNAYTAKKLNTSPRGNASRHSFREIPGIGHSNFYISNGSTSAEKMISNITKGILIKRVMAMHTVNTVSGDFSVGAAGLMIENGKTTFPVRGITIAGNLLKLLSEIQEIGDDLEFHADAGNCGSPSLLVASLSIGGK